MNDLHLVYDFSNRFIDLSLLLISLPFIVLGAFIFLYHKFNKADDDVMNGFRSRRMGIVVGAAFFIAGSFLLIALIFNIKRYYQIKDLYNSHKYLTIQGKVSNYHELLKAEEFDLNGVHFEYSDFDKRDYGYNNTAAYGGAIRSDLAVRIAYYNNGEKNVILKLEVSKK